MSDAYTYNGVGEPATYAATANGSPLLSYSVQRDAAGRITSLTEQIGGGTTTRGYEYDPAGRLSRVRTNGAISAEYDYDANSNRVARRTTGGNVAATYNDRDEMLTHGDTAYAYTAAGELRSRTVGGQTTLFDHDALGYLRRVSIPA